MTLEEFFEIADKIEPDENGCMIWPFNKNNLGYSVIPMKEPGSNMTIGYGGHRLSLERKLGRRISKGLFCCHSCDNPSCINPDHLWEGSQRDNMNDRKSKGKYKMGENHPNSKLTQSQADEIRKMAIERKITQYEIGKIYGVTAGTVRAIKFRRIYSD